MHEWLEQARDRIAAASGTDSAALDLSDSDIDALLDLARVAAHSSGDRTNAPLACYLVGLARGGSPELGLGELARRAANEE
ncbi:MAG TPA: DUF6457 domain-containing protein [Gaiellaceae bacterium]|nr:DUF6457 domain-containing protein [Gaiellaceae bacterium]